LYATSLLFSSKKKICIFENNVLPLRLKFFKGNLSDVILHPPPGKTCKYKKQMYVIVEIQGQQFKVEKDQKLFVHRIDAEEGAQLEFEKVLLADKDGNVTVGAPVIEGAKVVAEIVNPLVKGDKVLVFHKKRRKGHRKLNGHRQQFSQIVIKDIQA
jgi:large subunit ribosomal protein L21